MFTQNFTKLSAAVRELSCARTEKKKLRTKTIRSVATVDGNNVKTKQCCRCSVSVLFHPRTACDSTWLESRSVTRSPTSY